MELDGAEICRPEQSFGVLDQAVAHRLPARAGDDRRPPGALRAVALVPAGTVHSIRKPHQRHRPAREVRQERAGHRPIPLDHLPLGEGRPERLLAVLRTGRGLF